MWLNYLIIPLTKRICIGHDMPDSGIEKYQEKQLTWRIEKNSKEPGERLAGGLTRCNFESWSLRNTEVYQPPGKGFNHDSF
ncbi:hypothetical protein TNCV_3730401 [Trichonephila clavipes]|nr:hypothetical protein TNCV_3730401 [Trichonephila clavipes]